MAASFDVPEGWSLGSAPATDDFDVPAGWSKGSAPAIRPDEVPKGWSPAAPVKQAKAAPAPQAEPPGALNELMGIVPPPAAAGPMQGPPIPAEPAPVPAPGIPLPPRRPPELMQSPPPVPNEMTDPGLPRTGGTAIDALISGLSQGGANGEPMMPGAPAIGSQAGMLTPEAGAKEQAAKIAAAEAAVPEAEARAKQIRATEDANFAALGPQQQAQLEWQRKVKKSDADLADKEVVQAKDALRAAKMESAPTQSAARAMLEGLPKGVADTAVSTVQGAARIPGEAILGKEKFEKLFEPVKKALAKGLAPDPVRADELGQQIVQGAGSTVPFMAAGAAGALMKLSPFVTTAIAGALPQAEQMYEAADQKGAGALKRWTSFAIGAGIGTSEAWPVGNFFKRLEEGSNGKLSRAIGIMAAQAGEEGVQEFIQQVMENAAAGHLYDPDRVVTEGVGVNTIVGAMVGAGFGSAGAVHHALGTHEEKQPPLPEPAPFHDMMQTNAPGTLGTELRAGAAAAPDYGKTVPESKETLKAQREDLEAGKRDVVMYPKGTPAPAAPPDGMKSVSVNGETFHYDPAKTNSADITRAIKNGTTNELLGLGPYNKQQVIQAPGEPVTVTERRPDGTEIKAAAGTAATAPEQQQALEATKTAPENKVAVEPPAQVIADRGPHGEDAVLKAMGFDDEDIADMSDAERKANLRDAVESGMSLPKGPEEGTRAAPTTSPEVAGAKAVEPTPAQAEAGNYQKGHLKIDGLNVTIENGKGSIRSGKGPDGKPWSTTMPAHYGYVRGTEGADGKQVDVFIGDHPSGGKVYVIDQLDEKGKFDETKAILGVRTPREAMDLYRKAFSDGKGHERFGGMKVMETGAFREWLDSGGGKKPLATAPAKKKAERPTKPTSFIRFLAQEGGLRSDPDLSYIGADEHFVPGHGRLVRKGGMTLDHAREKAVEAGYLRDEGDVTGATATTTTNDVLDLVRNELHGGKHYSDRDQDEIIRHMEREERTHLNDPVVREKEAHDAIHDYMAEDLPSSQIDGEALDLAAEKLLAGSSTLESAYEDAIMQLHREQEDREDRERHGHEAGGKAKGRAKHEAPRGQNQQPVQEGATAALGERPHQPSPKEEVPPEALAKPPQGRDLVEHISEKAKTAKEPRATPREQTDEYQEVEAQIPHGEGPYFADGFHRRTEGRPRDLPSYFTKPNGKNAKDWLRGWDAAAKVKVAPKPPVVEEKEKPSAPPVRSDQGQDGQPGQKPEGGKDLGGEDLQQQAPGPASDAGNQGKGKGREAPLSQHFADYFTDPKAEPFKNILGARKFAKEKTGETDPKKVEEALEAGLIAAARRLAESGDDPKKVYDRLVHYYTVKQPILGMRTSTSIRDQAYSTPIPLAYLASRLAGIATAKKVLEPTAGNGALLIEAKPTALANEINFDRREALDKQGFVVSGIDASEHGAFKKIGPFDAIIANPPFGVVKDKNGESKNFDLSSIQTGYRTNEIDHAIALNALDAMAKNGRAVLILGAPNKLATGPESYRGKAKRQFYLTLYKNYNVVDHFTVDGDLYAKQGAGWPVDVIVIDGKGKSALPVPMVKEPRLYSSWDALKEKLDGREGAGQQRPGEVSDDVQGAAARPGDGKPGEVPGGSPDAGLQPSAEAPGQGVVPSPDHGQPGPAPAEGAPSGDTERGERPADRGGAERPVADLSDAAVDAAIDDAIDSAFAAPAPPATPPPKKPRAPRKTPAAAVATAAAEAASESVAGLREAGEALFNLFEPGGAKFSSGLTFDEETYARAKPHFLRAIQHFKAAGKSVAEMARALVDYLRESIGMTQAGIEKMKPYLRRFIQEFSAGTLDGPAQEAKPRKKPTDLQETEGQVTYVPRSDIYGLGTLVPRNMREATATSLEKLEQKVGNLTTYVSKELGYEQDQDGPFFMRDGKKERPFAAEQVDALALAIDNMNAGAALIIGDQTGIGKGRVNAGILRYAIQKKLIPVFVTQKPSLYKAMYSDMMDIGFSEFLGRAPKIIMTNAGDAVAITDDESIKLPGRTAAAKNTELNSIAGTGPVGIGNYDIVFTNYSQIQTIGQGKTPRQHFFEKIAPNSIIAMDESHTAGGQPEGRQPKVKKGKPLPGPNRAQFSRSIIAAARGAFYSSATYAKRPDVMDLYLKTDMRKAVKRIEDLGKAIARGGVPMQQAVASMLAKAGQYIRRERSFHGVRYEPVISQVEDRVYDDFSHALHQINQFSNIVKEVTKEISDVLAGGGDTVVSDSSVGQAGADSTNFTSVMHNLIGQMLLSINAQAAIDHAVAAMKAGEKPLLALASTNESFLSDYASMMDLKAGDAVDLDFSQLLQRYLDRTRTITIKEPFEDENGDQAKRKHYLTDQELGPTGVALYKAIKSKIAATDYSGLPVSPVDFIRDGLERQGYKVGEITGRTLRMRYGAEGKQTLATRGAEEKTTTGKNKTIYGFNHGTVDALILNRSGSTGLSMHASENFSDQRPRHMIITQPEGDINDHMQMLGRVHRTGQVVLPRYTQLIPSVPAATRPASILLKKMGSLNANTTASRKSPLAGDSTPDFMNKYGDRVVTMVLRDNPGLNARMDFPIDPTQSSKPDAIHKVTGRLPLLPAKRQAEFLDMLVSSYESYVEQLTALGENNLEARTLELDAKPAGEPVTMKEGTGTSPFEQPVVAQTMDVKRLGKPYPANAVFEDAIKALGADHPSVPALNRQTDALRLSTLSRIGGSHRDALKDKALPEFEAYMKELVHGMKDEDTAATTATRMDGIRDKWNGLMAILHVGARVEIGTEAENFRGIVVSLGKGGKAANPLALSTWRVGIAMPGRGVVVFPFSQLEVKGEGEEVASDDESVTVAPTGWIEQPEQTLKNFDDLAKEGREKRVIITGNLLSGFEEVQYKGEVVHYTDHQGNLNEGILMPRNYSDVQQVRAEQTTKLTTGQEVIDHLDTLPEGRQLAATDKNVSVLIEHGNVTFWVQGSKARGGKYYLSQKVLDASNPSQFYKRGSLMRMAVLRPKAVKIIDALIEEGAQFEGAPPTAAAPQASIRRGAPSGAVSASIRDALGPVPAWMRNPTPEQQASMRLLMDITQKIVARVAPQASVQFAPTLLAHGESAKASGATTDTAQSDAQYLTEYRLVTMALDVPLAQGAETAYHEAFHDLQGWGLINKQEKAIFDREQPRLREVVRNFYKFSPEAMANMTDKESEAYAFGAYSTLRDKGQTLPNTHIGVRRVWERMKDFFRRLAQRIHIMGYRTSEDVFEAARRGEIGKRPQPPDTIDENGNQTWPATSYALRPRRATVPTIAQPGQLTAPEERTFADALYQRGFNRAGRASELLGVGLINPTEMRVRFQDRFLRVKQLQQAVEQATGQPIVPSQDAYLRESQYYGRAGFRKKEMMEKMVDPLVEYMQEHKISRKEINDYLYAAHAEERNVSISAINPQMPDAGSGMSTAAAQQHLADVAASGRQPALENAAQQVYAINKVGLDARLASGLIDQQYYDDLTSRWQRYVPLRGHIEEDGLPHIGKGFDVRGKEFKQALGRSSRADDPLAYSIMQSMEALVRAEKNRVGQAMLNMVRANPNPDLWTVDKAKMKRIIDPATGMVRSAVDPSWLNDPKVMGVKIGGRTHRITFADPNHARAFKMMGAEDLGVVSRFVSKLTRYIAKMATSLNPDFVLANFIRDVLGALITMSDAQKKVSRVEFIKGLPSALKGAFQGERGILNSQWAKEFQELDRLGGRIRFFGREEV